MRLWTESFGNPADVPVLLVMGTSAQAVLDGYGLASAHLVGVSLAAHWCSGSRSTDLSGCAH